MLRTKTKHIRLWTAFFTASVLVGAGIAYPFKASAQGKPPIAAGSTDPLCVINYETIVTPRQHIFGAMTLWDAVYQPLGKMIRFDAAWPMESGTIMTMGRQYDAKTRDLEKIILAEMNNRGRPQQLQLYDARRDERPRTLLKMGDGFIAGTTYQQGTEGDDRVVRVAWYDAEVKFLRDIKISEAQYHLDITDIIAAKDNKSIYVVVNAYHKKVDNDRYAMVMRYDLQGKRLWKRIYSPGAGNIIDKIIMLPDETLFVTGQINSAQGRPSGWAMMLQSDDGAIMWQKSYPRGRLAILKDATYFQVSDNTPPMLIATGDVEGYDYDTAATWVIALNMAGEILWQRYIRRPDFNYRNFGVEADTQGRVNIAINAEGLEDGGKVSQRSHVRLFTMNYNGVIMRDEAFIEGLEAQGAQFLKAHEGGRVIIGTIDTAPPPTPAEMSEVAKNNEFETLEEELSHLSEDLIETEGWVFVASKLEPYDDPCLVKDKARGKQRK